MRKRLITFILAQIAAAFWAILSSKMIPDRFTFAIVAGLGFIAVGAYVILSLRRHALKNRLLSFWGAYIHLFIFTAPMVAYRLLHPQADFNNVFILWWSGPQFHEASEAFYLVWMVGTLIDLIRFWRSPSPSA